MTSDFKEGGRVTLASLSPSPFSESCYSVFQQFWELLIYNISLILIIHISAQTSLCGLQLGSLSSPNSETWRTNWGFIRENRDVESRGVNEAVQGVYGGWEWSEMRTGVWGKATGKGGAEPSRTLTLGPWEQSLKRVSSFATYRSAVTQDIVDSGVSGV